MKLTRASIEGYRSVRGRLDLNFEDRTTVILGANDHGKTNVLSALLHLNPDHAFDPDDLNFDLEESPEAYPLVSYTLRLSDAERASLLDATNLRLRKRDIYEFVAEIDAIDDALHEAAEAADAEEAAAHQKAEELSAAAATAEQTAPGSEEATKAQELATEAKGQASIVAAKAEEARAAAAESRSRYFLAVAEQLKAEAAQAGEADFDLETQAASAEKNLARAKTAASKEEPKVEAAQTEHQQAVTQYGAESEQAKTAEGNLAAAQKALADSQRVAEEWADQARELRRAADAAQKAAAGELAFPKDRPLPVTKPLKLDDLPRTVTFERRGIEGSLVIGDGPFADGELQELVLRSLPRVELIRPQEHLSDEADPESINATENDFMRGIFRYAGLTPEEWPTIFDQTDKTTKRLEEANRQLNATLREAWSQGSDLEFRLDHRAGKIDLQISDPAVKGRYVRASRRSSGFTHFFALKTMLYAREQAANASSFIWLFDEPGVFLHPEGQHDLLQVLETLAQANQIIYSTHSIFLFNKNHPTRHRLLTKNDRGTEVDQKPFTGQWRAAIDALGLSLPGTVLFASRVLLVEGDSDPILLNADLQKLIELGEIDIDINPLSIMSTGDSKHADALIRILLDSAVTPQIALLFDGDKGGGDRRKSLKRLIKDKKLKTHTIEDGLASEDCVLAPKLFLEATIRYVQSVSGDNKKKDEIRKTLEEFYAQMFGEEPPKSLAKWSREQGAAALADEGEEGEEISPVGIAREYAILVAEASADDLPKAARERALDLATHVIQMLGLESQTLDEGQIVNP